MLNQQKEDALSSQGHWASEESRIRKDDFLEADVKLSQPAPLASVRPHEAPSPRHCCPDERGAQMELPSAAESAPSEEKTKRCRPKPGSKLIKHALKIQL